jgi:AraC-like DNA-binding protein
MSISPIAVKAAPSSGITLGESGLLRRQALFRTCDLEQGRAHMCRVLGGEHSVSYLSRERRLDFQHRQAKIGGIAVNSLQYGAGVMISDALLPNCYLLQFTLVGECHFWQGTHDNLLPAGSAAMVNPGLAFKKAWLPGTRQLLVRIDKELVAREFHAWTGGDDAGGIEFNVRPIDDMAKVGTLVRYVRMVCDDLSCDASYLSHPLVADRVMSGLVSLLLASVPHNKTRAIEAAGQTTAPFFVRRVEQFIEEHAREAIALADLTGVAGVSTRALQTGFRRFRNTTPMAYLRSIRLELARAGLAKAGRQGASVAAVANTHGFGHLGRFARAYQAQFGELPSETLYRGTVGKVC